ncbi:translation initiation factor IF-2 subunit beta [Candidatus Woesearchaeota archaeon]|nr:translation initiation factor IF-2 subunit beta [Candidatus Woesearchaeota archaeon]
MQYEELLKRAMEKIPKKNSSSGERFDMPKVKGHIEGSKTIIINFKEVCEVLHREQKLVLKYLQRELATPAIIDGPRLVLGRKIGAGMMNQKVEQFANDYVLCKECKKPDTQLIKNNDVTIMKCTACGAKSPVRSNL